MTTFIEKASMIGKAKRAELDNLERIEELKKVEALASREAELFSILTNKYYKRIVNEILRKSLLGEFEAHMNFDRRLFCADYPGMGNPREVAKRWLGSLTQPGCVYLKGNDHLEGLEWTVFRNTAFTIRFRWATDRSQQQ